MQLKVILRGKERPVAVDNPATVGALRRQARRQLQSTPLKVDSEGKTVTLQSDEILLFQNRSGKLLQMDDEVVSNSSTYTAYEKFHKAPTDLYRTVKLNQIHPLVTSAVPSPWTQVTPLYCAALTKNEAKYPPFCVSEKTKKVLVSGASLQICNDFLKDSKIMPWDEITKSEERSNSRIDLNHSDFQDANVSPFGILHSPKLNGSGSASPEMVPPQKESSNTNTRVKKRVYFWRFQLRKGTDLQDVGMSVILDKDDGHCCLIPNENRSFTSREIVSANRPWRLRGDYLLEPGPQQPPPLPEAFPKTVSGTWYASFPVVAVEKFHFHDLVMRAASHLTCISWTMTTRKTKRFWAPPPM